MIASQQHRNQDQHSSHDDRNHAGTEATRDAAFDSELVGMKTVQLTDALGRVGVYTGSVDSESHLPCRGVMVYEQDQVVAKFDGVWRAGRWVSGQLVYRSGDVYDGAFDDSGLKTGHGTYTFADDGRIYSGEFVRDKQHGKGCLTWVDGRVYEGDFYENSRQGSGIFEAPGEGVKYNGSFYRGVYNGYGIYQSTDASVYRGNFKDGQPHGHGVMIDRDGNVIHDGEWEGGRPRRQSDASSFRVCPLKESLSQAAQSANDDSTANEESPVKPAAPADPTVIVVLNHAWNSSRGRAVYRGLWNVKNDCPTGNGTAEYDDLTVYEGFFDVQGNWHGRGRWSSFNGDAYEGTFVSGERHGCGVYTWRDGRQYQGSFEHNLRQGRGIMVYANNDLYEGEFAKGMRHGRGRFVFADGSVYQGEWQEGFYHGHGKLVRKDGLTYEGFFREGQAHGQGKEVDALGNTIHEGFWKNGKPSSEDSGEQVIEESTSRESSPGKRSVDQSQPDEVEEANRLEPACPPPASAPPAPPAESLPMSPPIRAPKSLDESGVDASNSSDSSQLNDYENCKAVVDYPLTDAQGNPGRYTGIVSIQVFDERGEQKGDARESLLLKPHGVGRMVYADCKRIHEGFWRHGNKHGHGRCLFFPQGDWHEGEYADNQRHGPGRYHWSDGRVYDGNYEHDLREGHGIFTFRSKDVYVGAFSKGKRSGVGRLEFAKGLGEYEGEWREGKYHGKGKLCQRSYPNESEGESQSELSVMTYEGEFACGMFHGFGKKTVSSTGSVVEGRWREGRFCGAGEQQESEIEIEQVSVATVLQPAEESSERNGDAPSLSPINSDVPSDGSAPISASTSPNDEEVLGPGYTV